MVRAHRYCGSLWHVLALCWAIALPAAAASPGSSSAAGEEDAASSHPRCALIDVTKSAVGALVEARLLEDAQRTWLERNEIERVLAEQQLQAVFEADAGRNRAALGRLLKADVLALLRTGVKEKQPYAELVVAETAGGLRILARSIPRSNDAEADADAVVALIDQAMGKFGETIREVYAVPPFLSQDLSHRYDHLQRAYAALLEESLLRRKGTLVVEIAEAEAISRELALAAPEESLRRRLPLYLTGEYRHQGRGEELRVSIKLRVNRGTDQLGEADQTLPPAEAPAVLLEMAGRLVSGDAESWAKPDADTESQQLAERASAFLKLGFWREATSLCEVSLLLKPAQPRVRASAIEAALQTSIELAKREDYAELTAQRQRAFEHFECLFRDRSPEVDRLLATMFFAFPLRDIQPLRAKAEVPEDLMVLAEQHRKGENLLAFRLADAYAERGNWDACSQCLTYARSCAAPGEYYDETFALILRHQDRIDLANWPIAGTRDSIEQDRFYRRLLEVPQLRPDVASRIRHSMKERRFNWSTSIPQAEEPPELPSEQADRQELTFRPIELYYTYKGVRRQLTWPTGCLTLDNGDDILWGEYILLKVSREGEDAQVLWAPERFRGPVQRPSYDGERLWLEYIGELWVIDPASGESWRITGEHGLPEAAAEQDPQLVYTERVELIVPLGNREAVVAGGTDRTWLARVRFSPDGNHQAQVFYEAKETSEHLRTDAFRMRQSSEYENAWKNPRIAFKPLGGALRQFKSNGEAKGQVLIWRDVARNVPIREHPLVVDLDDWSVRPMEERLQDFNRCIWYGGELYALEYERHDKRKLVRTGIPGTPAATLYEDVPEGTTWLLGDAVHLIGATWSEASLTQDRLVCHGPVPWQSSRGWRADYDRGLQKGDLSLEAVGQSNHFGVFVVCREREGEAVFARVVFDGTGTSMKEIFAGQEPASSEAAAAALPAPSPAPRAKAARNENLWESQGWRSYTDLAYSPDGRLLITTSLTGDQSPYSVQAWNALDGSLAADLAQGGFETIVAFSRSGKRFATGSRDGLLTLWDAATLEPLRTWKAHEKRVVQIAFSWDERRLASASSDRNVRVWATATGEKKLQADCESVDAWVGFAPGDEALVTGYPMTYWDLLSGDRVGVVETVDAPLAFTPQGRLLATANDVGRGLIAWDCRTSNARTLWARMPGRVVAVSPDAARIAVFKTWSERGGHTGAFNPLEVWNVEPQRQIAQTDAAPYCTRWAFSPDGNELVGVRGLLWRWNLAQSGMPPGVRTWTDSSGASSTQAAYLGLSGDAVRLQKADGSEITVPLPRLSKADQLFVDYQSRSATLPEAGPSDLVDGFGQWIDPQGDCTFAWDAYKLIVTVPGTRHDLTAETGNMDAPRLLQQVEGDFALQVTVEVPSGPDRGGVEGRGAYQAAGLVVMLDDKNYLRLEYAVMQRAGRREPVALFNCELRQNGQLAPEYSRAMHFGEELFQPHLTLERRGSELIPYVSAGRFGGHSFPVVRVPFPERLNVGVAVVNHSSAAFAPRLYHLTIDTPRAKDTEPPAETP